MNDKEMAQVVAIGLTAILLCVAIAAYRIGRSVGVSSIPTKEAVVQGLNYYEITASRMNAPKSSEYLLNCYCQSISS